MTMTLFPCKDDNIVANAIVYFGVARSFIHEWPSEEIKLKIMAFIFPRSGGGDDEEGVCVETNSW